MFSVLASEGINIMMISTSEIKISCVVSAKYTELAVRVLHDAFELGEERGEEASRRLELATGRYYLRTAERRIHRRFQTLTLDSRRLGRSTGSERVSSTASPDRGVTKEEIVSFMSIIRMKTAGTRNSVNSVDTRSPPRTTAPRPR